MKTTEQKMKVLKTVILSFVCCILMACESRTTVTETDKDTSGYNNNDDAMTQEQTDYKDRLDERIKALENRIDSLEDMRDDEPAKKTAIQAQIDKLEARKDELKVERERIETSAKETWQDFKRNVDDLLDKAEREIKETF